MRHHRKLLVISVCAASALLAAPAAAQALTVYAAASLRDAFPAINRSPSYNFGGSNILQLQIQRGAPADVFASASAAEPQALFREGRCTRPVTFATNRLVLLVPARNPAHIRSVYSLRRGGLRLSVGTPGVPVGAYTRKVLTRMRLSKVLSINRVSQESNVAQITSKVALGSADAGFAYVTDARAVAGKVRAISLPLWAQPPVRYGICAVKRPGANTAGAQAFIRQVTSNRGRRTLKRFGFGLPPRG